MAPLLSFCKDSKLIMIEINPEYEKIFNSHNIDDDCEKIAHKITVEGDRIIEILKAGMFKQAVTMYLQLMNSLAKHFIEDEHYCYFDDMYSPDYSLRTIYNEIRKYKIGEDAQTLLDIGHSEMMNSDCYQDYGYPSFI